MKIIVFGIGYVGLSNAILLAERNDVVMVDIIQTKIDSINKGKSPLPETEFIDAIHNYNQIKAIHYEQVDLTNYDVVIIATPTDYSDNDATLETKSIENIVEDIVSSGVHPLIVIRSTVPIGYTKKWQTNTRILPLYLYRSF